MIKKFLLMSLVLSQLAISCSSDDNNGETTTETEQSLAEQIANISKQPYSKLTPAEQKIKLEAEANEMLVQLDKSKSIAATGAIENLQLLLDASQVDLFGKKGNNKVEKIMNVSGAYGIYTWDDSKKDWVKTDSKSELKFVFPANKTQTTNNAIFTAKSTSSDIKIPTEDVNDEFFFPTSADATLTIDGVVAASFTQTAKYSNGKETPDEFGYKMTIKEGYAWEMSSTKATENTAKALFSYNGKNLIAFNSGSTANIDELLKEDALAQYRGKANGLITLMDNLVIVANMDLATNASEEAALEKNNPYPVFPDSSDPKADYKKYYTAENAYRQKQSEGMVANYNKNMKLILVSKKDGTKIADVVVHLEKEENSSNLPVWDSQNKYWDQWSGQGEAFTEIYYYEVYYLKFNDNTEVEMGAYFSTGFEKLESKFTDFIKAFEK